MKNLYRSVTLAAVSVALLSGCAVYVPTVPGTPLLRATGDSEVTGALRGLNSFELAGAYSPAPNLLVTVDGARQTSESSYTDNNNVTTEGRNVHQQGNVGVGTYHLLEDDQSVYLGALGGLGFASVSIYDHGPTNRSILGNDLGDGPLVQYQADYLPCYGQFYVAHMDEVESYGLSVRGTLANYHRLRRDGEAFSSPPQFFIEPALFILLGQGMVQGEGAVGISTPLRRGVAHPDDSNLAPTTLLVSLGVVFRPSRLWQKRE